MTVRCFICTRPFEANVVSPGDRYIAICGGGCYRRLEERRSFLRESQRSPGPLGAKSAAMLREML